MRNAPWTRDELILALDLFLRVNPVRTGRDHPEIQALSQLLNRLPAQGRRQDPETYRNPNSVYMKLCNFLRFDGTYAGKGLPRGGRLDEVIWNAFAHDRPRLATVARAIRDAARQLESVDLTDLQPVGDDEEFPEGRVLTVLHKRRERNPTLVRRKKEAVLQATGRLACEPCGFDFAAVYGGLGIGFAECHHCVSLAQLPRRSTTRLTDLAVVCANCHRMLHRSTPMLTVDQLREVIAQNGVGLGPRRSGS